ncbi:MAG TPA: hypothetical protein VF281_00535 [Candidatus Saccharimonadales bacterium]
MTLDALHRFYTLDEQTEFQTGVLELFKQDYCVVFGYEFDDDKPDYKNPFYENYRRAVIVLKWIMCVGSDSAAYMSYFRGCLGSEAMDQLDNFLYEIKDELPGYWRYRAGCIRIPL